MRDIVRPLEQYLQVREDGTAAEVLRLMERARGEKRPLCLLVVGQEVQGEETIKGFITPREVVLGLATRFLKGAGKSGPIFWEGQLASVCRDGLGTHVGKIMIPIDLYVRENEMLMEAVYLLFKSGREFLPVANKEEVLGTVHMEDLLKEMIEITSEESSTPEEAASGDKKREKI